MSDWLKRKDVCQRCFSGIDNDNDGNCATCFKLEDEQAHWLKKARFELEMVDIINREA